MQLVVNWKQVLLKSWAVWVSAAGLALPELIDFIAANSDSLPLSPEWKNSIRLIALALVIVVRPLRQRSLSDSTVPPKPVDSPSPKGTTP